MSANVSIQRASVTHSYEVAVMVGELLDEIMSATGAPVFNFNLDETILRLNDFVARDKYFVFVARGEDANVIGFVAVCESHALYAEGAFGTIPEFYVRPGCRSQGVGLRLLEAVKSFGNARGWTRLEVTTPPLPQFDKTLEFYEREGFSIAGGRKLKAVL